MDARRSGLVLLVLLLVGGCGGQSYEEGVLAICQSSLEAQVAAAPPAARATAAGLWIGRHVTNTEARELFASLAPLSPEQKARRVREVASRAGIDPCPLAEVWAPRAHP